MNNRVGNYLIGTFRGRPLYNEPYVKRNPSKTKCPDSVVEQKLYIWKQGLMVKGRTDEIGRCMPNLVFIAAQSYIHTPRSKNKCRGAPKR